ncbi:MAG: hypothetical protein AB7O47_12095 [Flavobacteriales bacterium]
MGNKLENINQILSIWNPIGVPEDIKLYEYRMYCPIILDAIENKKDLMSVLEDIIVNKMNLEYDAKNNEHISDLREICNKILSL